MPIEAVGNGFRSQVMRADGSRGLVLTRECEPGRQHVRGDVGFHV